MKHGVSLKKEEAESNGATVDGGPGPAHHLIGEAIKGLGALV
jgi:hypothetical protein